MKVLCACEESQTVCKEFRKLGFEAYSADIKLCSGGHHEWHLLGDVRPLLKQKWDLIIAFPPCTYLTSAGEVHFSLKRNPVEQVKKRLKLREEGVKFFMEFVNCECNYVAIENPAGYMNTVWRKPDQIIHPYYFGDPFMKRTCLWLKNLPPLKHTKVLSKPDPVYLGSDGRAVNWSDSVSCKDRATVRSKTFLGIARAMASQWGTYVKLFYRGVKYETTRFSSSFE
jgi:hypothetical protein